MSEGFSQPLQQETYAMVQSIEQRNLSGIFFMLDLTPTRSRRWVSQVAEEWAVGSVLFMVSLVQNFVLLVQRCVPSVVEHFRVHVSCYNTNAPGLLIYNLVKYHCLCIERERERWKTSSPTEGFPSLRHNVFRGRKLGVFQASCVRFVAFRLFLFLPFRGPSVLEGLFVSWMANLPSSCLKQRCWESRCSECCQGGPCNGAAQAL